MFPDTVKQAQGKSVVKPGFRGRGRLKYKLRRQKTAMKNVANHSSSFPYLLISVALSRAKLFFYAFTRASTELVFGFHTRKGR